MLKNGPKCGICSSMQGNVKGNNYPTEHYTMSSDQNQIIIEQVASEKDLGVSCNEKLLFSEHIVKKSH